LPALTWLRLHSSWTLRRCGEASPLSLRVTWFKTSVFYTDGDQHHALQHGVVTAKVHQAFNKDYGRSPRHHCLGFTAALSESCTSAVTLFLHMPRLTFTSPQSQVKLHVREETFAVNDPLLRVVLSASMPAPSGRKGRLSFISAERGGFWRCDVVKTSRLGGD